MDEQTFHIGTKGLFLNDHKQILLLKRQAEDGNDLRWPWDLPGGRMKKGEKETETVQREIEEEIGIERKNFIVERLLFAETTPVMIPTENGNIQLTLFIYQCRFTAPQPIITLSHEHTEYRWASHEEVSKAFAELLPEFVTNLPNLIP